MCGILAMSFLILAGSAQAFSLELSPRILNNWTAVTGNVWGQVLGEKLYAQVGDVMQVNTQPYQDYQPMQDNQSSQPQNTCTVNGQNMPGSCDQYNSQPMGDKQLQNNQQFMNNQNNQSGDKGPDQSARQLDEMRRGAQQMLIQVDRLDRNFTAAKKKGITINPTTLDELANVKNTLAEIKNATNGESLQYVDLGGLNENLNNLQQAYNEQVQQAQQLQNLKRDIKNWSNGIKTFEAQINKLKKQKIVPPVEVIETLAKIKSIITAVTAAKTWEEAEAAGIEDMQDLMSGLWESQKLMDTLSRWPKTLNDINAQLKTLNAAYKRDINTAKKLSKKDIDVLDPLSALKTSIDKLTAARDEATAKIKAGTADDVEEAFTILQDDFFGGQIEEAWASDKTINIMGNLTQFQAQSKKELTQAQNTINQLKKQKKDTSGLVEILALTKIKVAEIQNLSKAKPLDAEAVMDVLDELNSLRMEFADAYSELVGEVNDMPWEGDQGNFQNIQFNFNPNNYTQQQKPQISPAK